MTATRFRVEPQIQEPITAQLRQVPELVQAMEPAQAPTQCQAVQALAPMAAALAVRAPGLVMAAVQVAVLAARVVPAVALRNKHQ